MKRYFLIFLLAPFLSCNHEETATSGNSEPVPIYTDSVYNRENRLFVKFNSFDLFDTTYEYKFSSCTYTNQGFRLIDTNYEKASTYESSWIPIQSDSLMRMTVIFTKTDDTYIADPVYASVMYEQQKAARNAMKANTTPLYGNSELIGNHIFSYICFTDTIKREDKTETSVLLNAITYHDSVEVSMSFYCSARSCSGMEKRFLQILRTVDIEKLQVTQ